MAELPDLVTAPSAAFSGAYT